MFKQAYLNYLDDIREADKGFVLIFGFWTLVMTLECIRQGAPPFLALILIPLSFCIIFGLGVFVLLPAIILPLLWLANWWDRVKGR